MVGKMSKDIGMGVRKGTVVSFVPTLFGYFFGIPSLHVFSFCKKKICDLFYINFPLYICLSVCLSVFCPHLSHVLRYQCHVCSGSYWADLDCY